MPDYPQSPDKRIVVRFETDSSGRVRFYNPEANEIPVQLFADILKAIAEIEKRWNENIETR